jgi:hypothetical protein
MLFFSLTVVASSGKRGVLVLSHNNGLRIPKCNLVFIRELGFCHFVMLDRARNFSKEKSPGTDPVLSLDQA